jgi:hypothetical protein
MITAHSPMKHQRAVSQLYPDILKIFGDIPQISLFTSYFSITLSPMIQFQNYELVTKFGPRGTGLALNAA